MTREDSARLAILLRHWVEHNEEHAGEFAEWAAKAEADGKAAVHDRMMEAVRHLKEANAWLMAALEGLKEG